MTKISVNTHVRFSVERIVAYNCIKCIERGTLVAWANLLTSERWKALPSTKKSQVFRSIWPSVTTWLSYSFMWIISSRQQLSIFKLTAPAPAAGDAVTTSVNQSVEWVFLFHYMSPSKIQLNVSWWFHYFCQCTLQFSHGCWVTCRLNCLLLHFPLLLCQWLRHYPQQASLYRHSMAVMSAFFVWKCLLSLRLFHHVNPILCPLLLPFSSLLFASHCNVCHS